MSTDQNQILSGRLFAGPFRLIGLRVLIVDDSIDLLEMLHRKLKRFGAELEVAFHGAEAIELACTGEFDAIIMDVQMPKVDGPTAVQKLRARGFKKPIIALTTNDDLLTQRRCREAGYSAFIPKNVSVSEIVATLAAVSFHQIS